MKGRFAKNVICQLLQTAGITINGSKPWDIKIYHDQFYSRVLTERALGLGESYMEHWWDCTKLDEFFYRIVRAHLEKHVKTNMRILLKTVFAKLFNFQTKKRARIVGKKHYDLGHELFESMLDSNMIYSCGYWKNATQLGEAQLAKLELICKKLHLKSGMRVLDIGCGWGGFAKYIAKQYGVNVVGITISKQQADYAKQFCAGLPIEIRLQDYRDINESFDRIVSIGMFEHVGHLNYRNYMEAIYSCLASDGLFLLHTIGSNITYFHTNEWIDRYIFPNGSLPSIAQIGKSIEDLFVMEDWHNIGAHYDKTLLAWHDNFEKHWETKLKSHYDDAFRRMWNFYLLSCAGSFRARDMQLWQIVFSKKGLLGGYERMC